MENSRRMDFNKSSEALQNYGRTVEQATDRISGKIQHVSELKKQKTLTPAQAKELSKAQKELSKEMSKVDKTVDSTVTLKLAEIQDAQGKIALKLSKPDKKPLLSCSAEEPTMIPTPAVVSTVDFIHKKYSEDLSSIKKRAASPQTPEERDKDTALLRDNVEKMQATFSAMNYVYHKFSQDKLPVQHPDVSAWYPEDDFGARKKEFDIDTTFHAKHKDLENLHTRYVQEIQKRASKPLPPVQEE